MPAFECCIRIPGWHQKWRLPAGENAGSLVSRVCNLARPEDDPALKNSLRDFGCGIGAGEQGHRKVQKKYKTNAVFNGPNRA